jgi:hypothetical protein
MNFGIIDKGRLDLVLNELTGQSGNYCLPKFMLAPANSGQMIGQAPAVTQKLIANSESQGASGSGSSSSGSDSQSGTDEEERFSEDEEINDFLEEQEEEEEEDKI